MLIFKIICIYIMLKMAVIILAGFVSMKITDYIDHFKNRVEEYSKKYEDVKAFFVPKEDMENLQSTIYTFATGFSELSKRPIIGGFVFFPILLFNSIKVYLLLRSYEIKMDLTSHVCDLMDKVSADTIDEIFKDDESYKEIRKDGNIEKLIDYTFDNIMDTVREAGIDESVIEQVKSDFIGYWGKRMREQFNKKMMEA